jgi:4-amino-4-deoxy-L-arabinose transferase-like glycosyltransferase
MADPVFSPLHILVTAAVCALLAFLVVWWRERSRRDERRIGYSLVVALGVGLFIVVWRLASNRLHINEDFLPGVSPSDVGCGILPLLGLLALTPLHPSRRAWLVTSALTALAIFVCNVVLI